MEAARTDLLRVRTILTEQLQVVEVRLRTAQVACLLERPIRGSSDTNSSAQEPVGDSHSVDGESNSTQRGVRTDGHSYEGTIVRGGIGDSRRDD